jgi:RHS repeat-associated protein
VTGCQVSPPRLHRLYLDWDAEWNVISEENGCGTLTMTYVHDPGKVIGTILADVDSDDPSTGTYRYYFQDNIGSTRRLRNDSKTSLGSYEYTPYGQVYLQSGATIRYKFTGKEWDDTADLYYFPFRYYSPALARWVTREPTWIDGPNLYWYALASPASFFDLWGLNSAPAGESIGVGVAVARDPSLAKLLVDIGYWTATGKAIQIGVNAYVNNPGGRIVRKNQDRCRGQGQKERPYQQQPKNPFEPKFDPGMDPEVMKLMIMLDAMLRAMREGQTNPAAIADAMGIFLQWLVSWPFMVD